MEPSGRRNRMCKTASVVHRTGGWRLDVDWGQLGAEAAAFERFVYALRVAL